MLSIQCDDTTAASIIIDDATEITMDQEDWEISGRPTIGDTISFDVPGDGMFVDAFKGTRYLVTDEFERNGRHVVSFTDVAIDEELTANGTWSSYGEAFLEGEGEAHQVEEESTDMSDAEMELLSEFPGIIAPSIEAAEASTAGMGDTARRRAIKNMPSMRLMGQLMEEHGMSMRDIVTGLIAMENEGMEQTANEDVIVDFFKQNSDDIKDVSRNGGDYASDDDNHTLDTTRIMRLNHQK